MLKDFDTWNIVKKRTDQKEILVGVHERELWWVCFGLNIGVEIDGKHENYERPAIVIRKFNNDMIWVLPTTSQRKNTTFYEKFVFNGQDYYVALTQIRTISTKRLLRKSGMVSKADFNMLVERIKGFFYMYETPH